jgi:hypothetical protein
MAQTDNEILIVGSEKGNTTVYAINPGNNMVLGGDIDMEGATFSIDGEDLVISSTNRGDIRIEGFVTTVADDINLMITLPNGEQVPATQLLSQLEPPTPHNNINDIEPAAGPAGGDDGGFSPPEVPVDVYDPDEAISDVIDPFLLDNSGAGDQEEDLLLQQAAPAPANILDDADEVVTIGENQGTTTLTNLLTNTTNPDGGPASVTTLANVEVVDATGAPLPGYTVLVTTTGIPTNVVALVRVTEPSGRYIQLRVEEDGRVSYANTTGALNDMALGDTVIVNFDYDVTDTIDTVTSSFSLNIAGENDRPDAGDDSYTINEDTTLTVAAPGVLINDVDPDGDILTTTLVNNVSNGTLTLNTDGTFTYVPNTNFYGSDSFVYQIDDGNGGFDTATVRINVLPVNDTPDAIDDAYTTAEDTVLTIPASGVLVNDTDPDGDTLSSILVTPPTNGTVVLNADGSFTYTPNANYNGADSFVYRAQDASGDFDLATVRINVTPVNDGPDAVDDAYTTTEDTVLTITPAGVLTNDNDADGDTLTVQSHTQPTNGTVTVNADGSFTYTPNADYNGADSFTYTITDGNGGTDTATVNINVLPANDAPTANDDQYSTDEDVPLVIAPTGVLANDTDPDGDTLTVTSFTQPTNGTVTVNADGSFTYTPNANYNGADTFTYTMSDGNGGTDTATVFIGVNPVNDAPDAVDDAYSTDEDVPLVIAPSGVLINDSDVDGDAISVQSHTQPTNGSVTVNADGSFVYTPNANYNGADSFTYTITDGNGGTDTATVRINVTPVNDAPDAVDDAYSTDEDVPLVIAPAGVLTNDTDVDGDTLTVQSFTQPTNGTVEVNADGSFTYTPNADYNGADSFTYTITDGNGGTDTATVRINVTPVNDAPDAVDDAYATDEDVALVIAPAGVLTNDSDVDGDTLTVQSFTQPTNGTVTVNADGSFVYTPNTNYNGADSFTYTITDGNGGTDTATVNITVGPLNDGPDARDDAAATNEDTPITLPNAFILSNDSDPENDPLTITGINQISGPGTAVLESNGDVTYTPPADYNGFAEIEYTITDGNGGTDTAVIRITVKPVNDGPRANDDFFTTQEDMPITMDDAVILGNDTDPENDPLSIVSVNLVSGGGTVSYTPGGDVDYTPAQDYNGPVVLQYVITDGNGGFSNAFININVTPLNDAPDAVDDTFTIPEDTVLDFTAASILGNDTDPDGDTVSITHIEGVDVTGGGVFNFTTTNGGLAYNGTTGELSYTPNTNYNGADSFTYTITDGNGGADTATVNIDVTPVKDLDAVDDFATTPEDTPITLLATDILANDISDLGGALTIVDVQLVSGGGNLVVAPNGDITYTPAQDYNGPVVLNYTMEDGDGAQDTANIFIQVTPVNDAPDAVDDYAVMNEDSLLIIPQGTILMNDSDPDNDPLDITAVRVISGGGTAVLDSGDNVIYTPVQDYNGQVVLEYDISDGNGGTDTANIFITVLPLNDAPDAVDDAYTTAEDTVLTINPDGVLGNDTDVDGDTLTVQSFTQPTNGTVTVNADGSFDYTPNANYNGSDSFTYTITDGNGGTDTATVNINVTPVNDAPDAIDDAYTTDEDVPLVIAPAGVLTNDTDVDGDTLTVASFTQPTNGAVAVNADGSFTYTPNTNYNGADSFTYTITDGNGGTDTATVRINVTPVNDGLDAVDDTYTTDEDVPLVIAPAGVLTNDSDTDGDTLTVSSFTQPTNGTVTVNADGSFTYTPNANYNGSDSFTYTATDGNGEFDTATVNIGVNPINDAPDAIDDAYTTDEDVPLVIAPAGVLTNDTDVDGDSLTVASFTQPTNGTVAVNTDGSFTYTPNADYNGADSFTYTITDGNGGTDTATVNITVNPVADNILDDANERITRNESSDTAVNVNLLDNTTNPDGPEAATVQSVDGFTFMDGNGDTLTGFTVTPIAAPAGTVGAFIITNSSGISATLTVLENGEFSLNNPGNVFGEAGWGQYTKMIMNYTVTDGQDTDQSILKLNICNWEQDPNAVDDAYTTDEDTTLIIPASGVLVNDSDPDGDVLSVDNFTQPSHGVVSVNPDGSFTYTPNADYNGNDSFTYRVTDGNGNHDWATVRITVNPVNDPSEADGYKTVWTPDNNSGAITDPNADTSENAEFGYKLRIERATDVDGDTLTYQITTVPNANVGNVYYHTGTSWSVLTVATILSNEQIENLRFVALDDDLAASTDNLLSYDVLENGSFEGTTGSLAINTVLAEDYELSGDITSKSPNTSGNTLDVIFTHSADTEAKFGNTSGFEIVLRTDHNDPTGVNQGSSHGTNPDEMEVVLHIDLDGDGSVDASFQLVNFEDSGWYDSGLKTDSKGFLASNDGTSTVWENTVNSDDAVRIDAAGAGESLTDFLAAQGGIDDGDIWDFAFNDDVPGVDQGRYAAVDITSGEGSEFIEVEGYTGEDLIYGSENADILSGNGGIDAIYAGGGDDLIITDLQDSVIEGGSGFDTLQLDTGSVLDVNATTDLQNVTGIDQIDLTNGQTGDNLSVSVLDIVRISDSASLFVKGDGGDEVSASEFTVRGSDTVNDGTVFAHYTNGDGSADLYVELGLMFNDNVVVEE